MEELFEYYLECEDFHFKYARGEPALKEQEFHDYNEFVFFIKGDALFISKNIQQKLSPENIVLIPKENFHQFFVKSPESYTRCVLGFRGIDGADELVRDVMDEVKILSNPDKKVVAVFENIIDAVKSNLPDNEKKLCVRATLIQLLIFLKMNPLTVTQNVHLSSIVSRALAIIDEKYAERLTVDIIAELLYVSPSTLSHKFTNELNISIYKYITKKRLSVAHSLIKGGESISNAAFKSGFCDYSCFYRLYKKYYSDKKGL